MTIFPPAPINTVDWSKEDFKIREVHGHIESTYSQTTGKWTPLRFVTDPYVRIHGMAPAINYGQQAFEGIKAFRMPEEHGGGITLFRPDRNAVRFQHSARVLSLPPVPAEMFLRACRAAVALNAAYVPPHETGGALYVRPLLYGSSAQLGLNPPEQSTFCVYVVPTSTLYGVRPVKALILDDFDRAAPKGTGNTKAGGNYAPVFRWSDMVKAEGYGITLHLDSVRHEEVDEFSSCGFIGVISNGAGQVTLVVPDSTCVVDSITSDSVQQIARSFGWEVEKRPIKYTELPSFSEVIGVGTAVALMSIRSITRRKTRGLPAGPRVNVDPESETVSYVSEEQDGPGPVCMKLLEQLKAIQLGKMDDQFGWRFEVGAEDMHHH